MRNRHLGGPAVAVLVLLAQAPAIHAQTTPENGQKIRIGTDIAIPCSCQGNWCSAWPPPERFSPGQTFERNTVTAFVERGTVLEGQWQRTSGVGGTAVTEQYQGGRCVMLGSGGGQTDEPVRPVSVTMPGTYRLRITTHTHSQVYVFYREGVTCADCWDVKDAAKVEDRYFTVDPEPERACTQKFSRISSVTDAEGNELDDSARMSMGLGAPVILRGQTVRAPKSSQYVQINLEDGSIMRVAGGSILRFPDCNALDEAPTPLKIRIGLAAGNLWFKIVKAINGDDASFYEVTTERAVCGNRGTTFSVGYEPATLTTTVAVETGAVWLRNLHGAQQTIDIAAGQTGTQTADAPPRLKR